MTTIIGVVTAVVLAVVAASISARHGWVRWLFVIIYVVGTLGILILVAMAPAFFRELPVVLQTNIIAQSALQTAALIFMFSSASRHWFAAKYAETAA